MRRGGTAAGFGVFEGLVAAGWTVNKIDGGVEHCAGEHWQAAAHLTPQE